jgi:HPr kinase/phosphorylase
MSQHHPFRFELHFAVRPEDIDRLGIDNHFTDIFGIKTPTITLPVRPGRDLGRLIEVAAFETKLRLSGYNAAEEFTKRLAEKIKAGAQ